MEKYKDIINLPHKQSSKRPHMSLLDRAAQFAPFAALVGYDDAIKETGRLTDERIEMSEESLSLWKNFSCYQCAKTILHFRNRTLIHK